MHHQIHRRSQKNSNLHLHNHSDAIPTAHMAFENPQPLPQPSMKATEMTAPSWPPNLTPQISVQTEKAISNSPEPSFRQIWWPVRPVICLYMFHISEHCSEFFKRSLTFQTFQPLWFGLKCLIVLKLNLFKTSQCLFEAKMLLIEWFFSKSTPLDSRHCQILRMKCPALEMFLAVATLPSNVFRHFPVTLQRRTVPS